MTRIHATYRAAELIDEVEGIVRGYAFIWGSTTERDSYDTWFDKSRPPEISYDGNLAGCSLMLEHGQDPTVGRRAIGVILRTWYDDVGLAFEARLDKSDPVYERVLGKILRGELYTSSSSAEHVADWREDGSFESWTMTEQSLTESPAESRIPAVSLVRSVAEGEQDASRTAEHDPNQPMERTMVAPIPTPEAPAQRTVEEDVMSLVESYGLEAVKAALSMMETPQEMMSAPADARSSVKFLAKLRSVLEQESVKQAHQTEMNAMRSEIDALKAANTAARNAPPVQNTDRFTRGGSVSVGEDLRYAHLTAEQMALGVKLVRAGLPAAFRNTYRFGDMIANGILSEDYVRSMANKAIEHMKDMKPRRDPMSISDHATLRSSVPFRADELHATDIATHGSEWVEAFYDTTLWERARDRTELFNLLQSRGMEVVTVPDGANAMNVKTNTASGTVYTLGEGGSLDATGRPEVVAKLSQITTGEVEEPVSAHVLAQGITFFLEEDSIINIVSWLPGEMETTLAEALESAMLNGDKTTTASSNINLIDGTPATGLERPLYLAFDGIRHNAIIDNSTYARDAASAALSITDYEDTIKKFPSAIKQRRNQMLFIIDDSTEHATRKLPELLTVGVAGQQATIYSGALPPLFGVDIYMSGQLALSNTAGKISVTGSNNTKGTLIAVYAPYWKYGRKRTISIEQDRYAMSQATVFVATVRHAFKARGAGATALTYALTV